LGLEYKVKEERIEPWNKKGRIEEELLKKEKNRREQDVEDERRKDYRKYGEKAESKQVWWWGWGKACSLVLRQYQMIYRGPGFLAVVRFGSSPPPLPSLVSQQIVSLSQSSCVSHTVYKQRSLNLLFSSMFCIERKIVHVGAEKIITLYY
jgi:hypothetical protein